MKSRFLNCSRLTSPIAKVYFTYVLREVVAHNSAVAVEPSTLNSCLPPDALDSVGCRKMAGNIFVVEGRVVARQ